MSTEECSSNESGWTAYIGSPYYEHDHDHDHDDDDEDGSRHNQEGHKGDAKNGDSDDSMASDASSGQRDQHGHVDRHRGLGHAENKNERKLQGPGKKNHQQQEEKRKHDEPKIKAAKNKSGSAGKSKKR